MQPSPNERVLANEKSKMAAISVLSNTALVLLKAITGIMIGSVSVVSEAIHSGLDLAAALIALLSVRASGQPPDTRHRYGHGKYENVSGTIEALLIFVAAVWIILEAWQKIVRGSAVETVGPGLIVMAISALVNLFLSNALLRTAKKTDSIALEADGMHLRTDVYTSAGVAAGLAVLAITRLTILDPLIAIGVALLIIKAAWDLIVRAFNPLLDVALPCEEEAEITGVLTHLQAEKKIVNYHRLRTRRAGPERHVDVHLVVPRGLSINEVHQLCDRIEEEIAGRLGATRVLIHAEPCSGENCSSCSVCSIE